jgi:tight adherence protein C
MVHFLMLAALAILVFGISASFFLALLLRPPKEAQRAIEIVVGVNRDKRPVLRRERFLDGLLSLVQGVRTRLHLAPSKRAIDRLAAAGYRNASAVEYYLAAQVFFPLVCGWCGGLVKSNALFWGLICGIAGFFTPELWLAWRIRRRRNRIRRSLPDTIDLLVICVDAGLGLDQAVLRVSEELAHSHPELQEELHRLRLEQKAGCPRLESWQNLAARVKLQELTSLVGLFVQAERSGTQITKALSSFADDLRLRQRQRIEEVVAETKIKIIFPLVFFIFPCLFIVLLGPALLKITRDLKDIMH